jgi:hypothetical protein
MRDWWHLTDDWLYRHAGMPPVAEWPWFHIVVFGLSAIALFGALRLYLNPPSFEKAKWWGIDRKNYRCIRPLAGLAAIEAAISAAVAAVAIIRPSMMPWPVDVFAFLMLLLSGWLLYRNLCKRETFKHAAFYSNILVPLGLSFVVVSPGGLRGMSAVPKAVASIDKLPALERVPETARRLTDAISLGGKRTADALDDFGVRAGDAAGDAIEWATRKLPREVDALTVSGRKRFMSRSALGGVGESVTVHHYEDMGLKYYKSQVGSKGIDAVFAKYGKNGDLLEVYVVETKVNGSRLSVGQMTDEWIRKGCMQAKKNSAAKKAAELVEKALDPANNVVLHRELMHVATDTGIATRYSIAANGEIATKQWTGSASEAVAGVVARMEAQGSCKALPDAAALNAL